MLTSPIDVEIRELSYGRSSVKCVDLKTLGLVAFEATSKKESGTITVLIRTDSQFVSLEQHKQIMILT